MGEPKKDIELISRFVNHFKTVKAELWQDSSQIINEKREKALKDFEQQGIPNTKFENYKYTNLEPVFAQEYSFCHQKIEAPVNFHELFKCDVPQLDTNIILLINGWFYKENNPQLPEGVLLMSMEEAANKYPELLKEYTELAKTDEDPMVALNTAFTKDGFFFYVPKGVILDTPIQILNVLNHSEDTMVFVRNFVKIEEGAEAKLLICDHTKNLNNYLSNAVTEVVVGKNAKMEFYNFENIHNNTNSINSVFIKQDRDSQVLKHTTTLHGGLIRNNLKIELAGENANVGLFGMSFSDKKQHVDNFTQVVHAQPNCYSNQFYKNVLDDESVGAFAGRIHVVRDAQKTNAFQTNNNLLLTDNASMKTKPQLIIDADDVKCSHGATIGQIDENALFYLRARGINEEKARLMMMNAFAHEVVQKIKIEPLRERIDYLITKRLRGEVARCHECAQSI
ncbi:MAG: Fe-S cluster assembly protein SufD [Draconibacterium sp.]|nr:MAG: Fe-S cluster assembly protein SufD [Draconibacterium sp.]